jgi:hypothetical protein
VAGPGLVERLQGVSETNEKLESEFVPAGNHAEFYQKSFRSAEHPSTMLIKCLNFLEGPSYPFL